MSTTPNPNSPSPQRFPTVIVGAGPAGAAGAAMGNILRSASVDCLVLEAETREFIERRPRAGALEEWAVRGLEQRGLAAAPLERVQLHSECEFRVEGRRHRCPYTELTGYHHYVYPQPLLVTDLMREYADVRGGEIRVRRAGRSAARPGLGPATAHGGAADREARTRHAQLRGRTHGVRPSAHRG